MFVVNRFVRPVLLVLLLISAQAHAWVTPQFWMQYGQRATDTPYAFDLIRGIAVDSENGEVYLPAGQVKRYSASGTHLTTFGNCQTCANGDVDEVPGEEATNHLYVARPDDKKISQYTPTGTLVREWGSDGAGPGQFFNPFDVAVDSAAGEVYVIDSRRVQVFNRTGDFIREWGSEPGPGQLSGVRGPCGIAFDSANQVVWVAEAADRRLVKYDRFGNFILEISDQDTTGHALGDIRWARDVEVDSVGNVYQADTDNERIQVFDTLGNPISEFRGPHDLESGPFHPRALAVNHATDDKWVLAAYAYRFDKFDADDEYVDSWGDIERDGPVFSNFGLRAIAVSQRNGDLFVMDGYNFLIKRFSAWGVFRNQFGGSARLDPWNDASLGFDSRNQVEFGDLAIATDAQGKLWHAATAFNYLNDPQPYFLRRFEPTGESLAAFRVDKPVNQLHTETDDGLAVDPLTNLIWISDSQRDQLRVHAPDGSQVMTIPSVPEPSGIAIDGNHVFVSSQNDFVRKYTRQGTLVKEWGINGGLQGQFRISQGAGVAVDNAGNVWVADTLNHRIQAFTANGDPLGMFGANGTGPSQFRQPHGIAIYKALSLLYVADTANYRVQAFLLPVMSTCADGFDNDGDGSVDFGSDAGCANAGSLREDPSCSDGADNDGDGLVDFDGGGVGAADPGCQGVASRGREQGPGCGLGFELAGVLLLLLGIDRRSARR